MKSLILLVLMTIALPLGAEETVAPAARVDATYFHRTFRCQTCLQIEDMARYAVEMERAEAVEAGHLTWRAVNFEEEEVAGVADEYGLESPTLVLALVVGGEVVKSRRLEKTWDLYGDAEKFDAYVLGAVDEFLKAASASGTRPESE